ncbi:sigma-54-dependent transcriptional regulator [Thermoanaerobacterium thermosaccharolyticum]|uniref:sigma-54-dependent transcriptional regulator n=1 Tax=Thermoanaerobacterium thermosaccharolyticum TaxID=1517 RepID=UPI003D290D69
MKRKEIVFEKLKELCLKKYKNFNNKNLKRFGFSAQELSEILNLDRANVSKDLNELVKERKIIKFVGRPILFFPKDMIEEIYKVEIDSFEIKSIDEAINKKDNNVSNIIGSQGSLKSCFEQLNVAILYPPFGLHTLLYGKTGVGKSMLAELMFTIAQEKLPDKFKSFVAFNCADYAQSPNLLMTELFGSIKGAYTGADTDRKGIIENANNGILFLDEVHRLPPEGQEMLFYVMDKGLFRRVGETKDFRKVNILIVCATTEKPENVLLPTFYRRIPIKIYVPDYLERPIEERKQLVKYYFNEESRILNKTFNVDSQVIDILCNYDCKGNIGQVKNDIKIMSARAFAQAITNNENKVTISYEDAVKVIGSNNATMKKIQKDYIVFDGKSSTLQSSINKNDELYENLLNIVNELSIRNCSKQEIEKAINNEINRYFNLNSTDSLDDAAMTRFVENEFIDMAKLILDLAKNKLNKNYNSSNVFTLALHLKSTINRLKSGHIIKNNKINYIRKKYPNEFFVAMEAAESIEKMISTSIPLNEIGFITLFLVSLDNTNDNYGRVGIVIVCHGDYIASSMLNLANKMLGKNIGIAIDVPLEKGSEPVINEITEAVKKSDQGKGVLILFDMGLVSNIKDIIMAKSGVKIEIIDGVNTPMLLRALEKSLTFDDTVEKFKKEIMSDYHQEVFYIENKDNDVKEKKLIIIYCITGKGTSIRLKDFIYQNIDKQLLQNIEIIVENEEFSHLSEEEIKLKYGDRILAIVGTFKNNYQSIPYISAEEILLKDGIKRLLAMVESVEGYDPYKEGEMSLSKVLKFVNPTILVKELKRVIINFENYFNKHFDSKLVAIIILHFGCLVEDLILGKKIKSFDDFPRVNQNYHAQIQYLKDLLRQIEMIFNISIPDSEIAEIVEILMENE